MSRSIVLQIKCKQELRAYNLPYKIPTYLNLLCNICTSTYKPETNYIAKMICGKIDSDSVLMFSGIRQLYTKSLWAKTIETGMILLIMDIEKLILCIFSKTYKFWCIESVLYWCKYPISAFLGKWRRKIVNSTDQGFRQQ